MKPKITIFNFNRETTEAIDAILNADNQYSILAGSKVDPASLMNNSVLIISMDRALEEGYRVAQSIRSVSQLDHIPLVIVLPDINSDLQVFEGMENGSLDVFMHPFNPIYFNTKVDFLLRDVKRAAENKGVTDLSPDEDDAVELKKYVELLKDQLHSALNLLKEKNAFIGLSTEEIKQQSEELKATNLSLEEKIFRLEQQKKEIEKQNKRIVLYQDELSKRAEELEIASLYRKNFMFNVSAEILSQTKELAGTLNECEAFCSSEKLMQINRIVQKQKKHLKLIKEVAEDISNCSTVSLNTTVIEETEFSYGDVVTYLSNLFSSLSALKNISLKSGLNDSEKKIKIKTDFVKLRYILRDITEYLQVVSESGSVDFSITADSAGLKQDIVLAGSGKITLCLLFKPVNPDEEATSELLESFSLNRMTDVSKLDVKSRIGICKSLAMRMNGDFRCERYDGGIKFTLTVPQKQNNEEIDIVEYHDREEQPLINVNSLTDSDSSNPDKQDTNVKNIAENFLKLDGKKVLICDDDMRSLFALTALVQKRGMVVTGASNGKKAEEKLNSGEELFDVVLMDMMMPIQDGYTTIRNIRKCPEFSELPIIAVTANDSSEGRQKCIEAGASDYVAKPVDVDHLVNIINIYI